MTCYISASADDCSPEPSGQPYKNSVVRFGLTAIAFIAMFYVESFILSLPIFECADTKIIVDYD